MIYGGTISFSKFNKYGTAAWVVLRTYRHLKKGQMGLNYGLPGRADNESVSSLDGRRSGYETTCTLFHYP